MIGAMKARRVSISVIFALVVTVISLTGSAQTGTVRTARTESPPKPAASGEANNNNAKAPSPRSRINPRTRLQMAKTRFVEGQKAYQQGLLARALLEFQEANRLVPSAELAYNIGQVYEQLGDPQQAVRFLKLYLSRSGSDAADRLKVQAQIERLRRMPRQPRQEMRPAPAQVTGQAREHFERGVALFNSGEYKEAMVAFTAAEHLFPVPELSYNMAVTSEWLKRDAEAIEYYSAYLRDDADAPDQAEIKARISALQKALTRPQ
jgi:tetratricopeptide (TPR) repeat protein